MKIWVSYEKLRKRLQNRDNISKEEAMLKISNQMDIEEKKSLGTYIIDNSKDLNIFKMK